MKHYAALKLSYVIPLWVIYIHTYIYIYTYDLYMFTSISVSLSEGEVSLPSVLECARRFGVAIAGHGPS